MQSLAFSVGGTGITPEYHDNSIGDTEQPFLSVDWTFLCHYSCRRTRADVSGEDSGGAYERRGKGEVVIRSRRRWQNKQKKRLLAQ